MTANRTAIDRHSTARHLGVCGIPLLVVLLALPAYGATFKVNGVADPGTAADGVCTLREAVASINTSSLDADCPNQSADTLGVNDTVDLTGVSGTITLTSGAMAVEKSALFNGPGASVLTLSGNQASGIFEINTDFDTGVSVGISKLRLAHGVAAYGGAVFVGSARLVLSDSVVTDNMTVIGSGGAIYLDGPRPGSLELIRSTIAGNQSHQSGGGIYSDRADVTITGSTLSGNRSPAAGSALLAITGTIRLSNTTVSGNDSYFDGATTLDFQPGTFTTITHSTIAQNANSGPATDFASAIRFTGVALDINNSIVVHDDGSACSTPAANSNSLFGDTSCNGVATPSVGVNLGPLADNGGPTKTHSLLTGSAAIDAISVSNSDCLSLPKDQRDLQRPAGAGCDVGAFEVQPTGPTYLATVQQPINADGSSTFNSKKGVVPVKFRLKVDGMTTCTLPAATIRVTRVTSAGVGAIDESDYLHASASGSNFRITDCQYQYNLNSKSLAGGKYIVELLINGASRGTATFELK